MYSTFYVYKYELRFITYHLVTDPLVPVPQNYGISSQVIFGQLGVWQTSNVN